MSPARTQDSDTDFCRLMERVAEGSEEAAWEVVQQYGDAIRRAIRRTLHWRLRRRFDSLDFVQLVWASFFRARDRLDRFDRPQELAAFLAVMAKRKVAMEMRRQLATSKHGLHQEYSFDEDGSAEHSQVACCQPTPVEVAIAREEWTRILQDKPEHYRQIIRLRLAGRTYQEIADSLSLDKSTVYRFLKRLARRTVR